MLGKGRVLSLLGEIAGMVLLGSGAIRYVRSWLAPASGPGLLALRHAVEWGRPGLWGDDARRPASVVLLRPGDDGLDAFGEGEPGLAVGWLARRGESVTLLAPEAWEAEVVAKVGAVDRRTVQTWTPTGPLRPPPPGIVARKLHAPDADAFAASAPAWALRGWGSFAALIGHGAAFGVPHGEGFAALAWVFDQSRRHDALGVHTMPRYRRLGLGRAAATALIAHVVRDRHKFPLWSTAPGHSASVGLARALGLSVGGVQALLQWPPGPGGSP